MRRPRLLLLLGLLAAGCRAQRTLEITSDPPGAEVRLDDQTIGLTPVRVSFEHYGTRRLTFYLPGYRTSSRRIRLRPPWYGRFPLDLASEVLLPFGIRDRRHVHQDLVEGQEVMGLPSLRSVIERANALRQSGPEGPRDLPDVSPALVPSNEAIPENGSAPVLPPEASPREEPRHP